MDPDKRFELRCMHCRYCEFWTGITTDAKHLYEIKKGSLYRGPRLFRCPKCGHPIKAKRIQGNAPLPAKPEAPDAS